MYIVIEATILDWLVLLWLRSLQKLMHLNYPAYDYISAGYQSTESDFFSSALEYQSY